MNAKLSSAPTAQAELSPRDRLMQRVDEALANWLETLGKALPERSRNFNREDVLRKARQAIRDARSNIVNAMARADRQNVFPSEAW